LFWEKAGMGSKIVFLAKVISIFISFIVQ